MKILHIVEATFAGVGRHVLDLAECQAKSGHDVHIAYNPIRESSGFRLERENLGTVGWHRVTMTRTLGRVDVSAFRELSQVVKEVNPDVVHGHSTKGGLFARLLRCGSARIVYTPNAVYSMNPLLGRVPRGVVAVVERLLATRTDVIVAVSPEEESHLRSIGIAGPKVQVIPNGIQPITQSDPSQVRQELGLPEDAAVVGFVGRLDAQKAPDDLLRIFARIAEEDQDAHFAVVGEGPLGDALAEQAETRSLGSRLHMLGVQPGTWAMSGFDLLVLPSRYEGFPYVLIEAAHLGLPIVTTDRSCASLLEQGPALVAVEACGDIEAMALASLQVLRDRGDGTKQHDRRFTIEVMTDSVDRAYRGDSLAVTGMHGGGEPMQSPPTGA